MGLAPGRSADGIQVPQIIIFFFNVTPTTEIYTLSLHDALPILAEMNATAQLNEKGNGTYAGSLELGSGGTWQVTISAEQGGKLMLTKRLNVTATGGM